MKFFITLLLVAFTSSCSDTPLVKPKNNDFVLTNVNIVDTENQIIQRNKTIAVSAGKIQAIASSAEVLSTNNAQIIDGKGGYVTPGLIDMHVHMYEKAAFALALTHGVTHVRIMNGVPNNLIWRDQIAKGQLIGSSATVSSPIVSGYKSKDLHYAAHTAEDATAAVKQFKAQGYDLIKAYGNLSEEVLSALIHSGKLLNMPIAKHGPHASGDMHVSALEGLQSFEHVEDIYQGPLNYKFDLSRLPVIAADISATKVPITPTLNIYYQLTMLSVQKESFLSSLPSEYISDIISFEAKRNQVKRWLTATDKMASHNQKTLAFLQHITEVFSDAGITMLVGSDSGVLLSPHGVATHNEMRLMHEAGLTAHEVLAAATVNAAKALNLENELGKVSEDYQADFIFSKTNPIEDMTVLREPEAVVKAGIWYSRQALTQLKLDAIESRSIWEELKTLLEAL